MSIAPPGNPTEGTESGSGNHEFKSVQALRGRENSAKAKWQNQGWEFVSENRGTLRTELNFRRVKPKTLGSRLLSMFFTSRRPQPKKQSVLVASCALILVAGIIGIVMGPRSGTDTQKPSAAQTTTSTVTPSSRPSNAQVTTESTATQSTRPSNEQVTTASTATPSRAPKNEQILTAKNSAQVAALLKVSDYCDGTIAPVAAKLAGRTIGFDGSIVNLVHHGDYKTRYDILVAPGDKGPQSTVGPAFKFENVNFYDLNVTAKNVDSVGEGDRFHFVARVVEYNPTQCLLFLEPVSTSVR
ncbi:MAG TPA: DUF4839 domain-containing protein [Solirubrobacteraceae bacterium]|nr:DUF4839 domain-containing protein [Solirubrobacteraceae bacterium]